MNDNEHIHWVSVMWIVGILICLFIISTAVGTLKNRVDAQDKTLEALIKHTYMPVPIATETKETK